MTVQKEHRNFDTFQASKFFAYFFFSTLLLLVLSIWFSFNLYETRDDLIQCNTINEKTVIVKLGFDAITAVSTQIGIIIIDAGISNSLTSKYREIIEDKFNRNDFAYLINTHSHHDHTGGNQVFKEAMILGHDNCVQEMTASMQDSEKIKSSFLKIVDGYQRGLDSLNSDSEEWQEALCQKIRYQHAYNDIAFDRIVTLPTITFSDSIQINAGDATFDLKYFGHAHSDSDILIHIPEFKVLMIGDLFSSYGKPSFADVTATDTLQWKSSIRWLTSRLDNIEVVISGHGKIFALKDLISFIENTNERCEDFRK